jgi:hypothetical protein
LATSVVEAELEPVVVPVVVAPVVVVPAVAPEPGVAGGGGNGVSME